MGRSINQATIHGNVSFINEHNTPTRWKASVATNSRWRDKQTGEYVEKAEFHSVVAFGKTAEICNGYITVGMPVTILGRITYNEHEGKRYTDILINEIVFSSSGSNAPARNEDHYSSAGRNQGTQTDRVSDKFDLEDDDLPF